MEYFTRHRGHCEPPTQRAEQPRVAVFHINRDSGHQQLVIIPSHGMGTHLPHDNNTAAMRPGHQCRGDAGRRAAARQPRDPKRYQHSAAHRRSGLRGRPLSLRKKSTKASQPGSQRPCFTRSKDQKSQPQPEPPYHAQVISMVAGLIKTPIP